MAQGTLARGRRERHRCPLDSPSIRPLPCRWTLALYCQLVLTNYTKTQGHAVSSLTNASLINLQLDDLYVPVRWNWEPLSRTKQSQILTDDTIVPGELRVAREFWLPRGNRLCRRIRKSEDFFRIERTTYFIEYQRISASDIFAFNLREIFSIISNRTFVV